MFGNSKKNNSTNGVSPQTSSSAINTLVVGTQIEGTIVAKSDLRIDGIVDGTLNCSGKLIIGPEGKVDGKAHCQNAVIEGNFRGELTVNDTLDVREGATVVGEIKTGKLLVQTGAVFNGNCDMGQKVKSIPKNKSKAEAQVS